MSDKSKLIPESIDNAVNNLTDLPSKSVGQTLSDCWFLVFGGISQLAEKRKLKYAHDLEAFKQSLSDKVSSIPEENRIEPNMQSVMPALENVKYCVEEKELREMFANLISSSLDDRLASQIHPSFSEILKIMTPLDAQNLKLIQREYHLPICNIIHINEDDPNQFSISLQNVFLMNPNCTIYEQQSLSINFLLQQGLIEIPYNETVAEPDAYTVYESCDELLQICAMFPDKLFGLQERLVRLTSLGHSFLKICCPD